MVLNARFRRTLRAQNKSDRTVEAYTNAVRLPAEFCKANGHPLTVKALKREHIELFIADQLARWKPATANNRYRGLQSFFRLGGR
jgi:site-specific recombinase XerD